MQSQSQYRSESSDVSIGHGHERRERCNCPAAHNRAPFVRRPVTRVCCYGKSVFFYSRSFFFQNSNILSAVLRLVKELDYPSLEVVEMEVRSRMDELDE